VLVDPRTADDVLTALRKWGWELGLGKLRAAVADVADEGQRARHRLLLGWLAGDLGRYAEAVQQLQALQSSPALGGWALTGLAFMALRERSFAEARAWLDRAAVQAAPGDIALHATIAHARGTLALREGHTTKALVELHGALELFGPLHFGTGRVLDTLGTVHAVRDNFAAAVEFYSAALDLKRRCQDEPGVALTHGQLGRLFLDWGRLDQADDQFHHGLELDRRLGDARGEAQLCNHRGQVQLLRGWPDLAAVLLDESIRLVKGRHRLVEAYAHKDLALAHLARGQCAEAGQALERAEALFAEPRFDEGMAHTQRVQGMLWREQGRCSEALVCLRASASFFQQGGVYAEAARSLRELARTLRAAGAATGLVAEALLSALDLAERSRRGYLVREIESELREAAEVDYLRRVARRKQFEDCPEDWSGMFDGKGEDATVLLVDLRPDLPAGEDAVALLPMRNHLYADLLPEMEAMGVQIVQYQGDGFVALLRGKDHSRAAVAAALGVARALAEFNRPRRVLGWPLWQARTGICSGIICLGGSGTFQKRRMTAIGTPVSVAAALQAEAEAELPCVSQATHQRLEGAFAYTPASPRTVYVKGLGPQRAWDVTGFRE
jgi:class 3 adenylate cyclase